MKKILVIRFRRVGDSVISSTLCSSLKKSIPNSEIHYVLNEHIAPLFESHLAIDKLITFSNDDMSGFFSYMRKVRQLVKKEKYDIIIDTRSTMKTLPFSLFSLGTKYRIGRKKGYNYLIQNYRIDNHYKTDAQDIVETTLMLLDPLKKEFNIQYDPYFKLYYTEQERLTFRKYMEGQGIDFSKPVVVCAVTTRLLYKVWPMDKMREVLSMIIHKYGDVQLIFNYGDKIEKENVEKLHKELEHDKHIFTNIEANTLRELIAMLVNSSFFFGNEGGTRHISQALDMPSFAIYPPNIPLKHWLPNRSERFQGIELADINKSAAADKNLSYQQKMELIDVESVWEGLDKMLQNL